MKLFKVSVCVSVLIIFMAGAAMAIDPNLPSGDNLIPESSGRNLTLCEVGGTNELRVTVGNGTIEGTYTASCCGTTDLFGTYTRNPILVDFYVMWPEGSPYCSWTFEGSWDKSQQLLVGEWWHIPGQSPPCTTSGEISFRLGPCN